jgi:hypothetical protein
MANEKLQYTLEVVDKASEELRKVQKSLEGLQGQSEKAGKAIEEHGRKTEGLTKSFITANLATQAITRGLSFVITQYRQSKVAAAEYQKAMIGLKSTAAAFGESQDAATAAAQRLTSDGMLNMADASKALQNIMNTGLGLDKAEQLIRTYKDQAALGRAANLSFSQAVSNLSESFMTESSAIGNLSGQSENYNQIIERGANILGKSVASLTEAERQQAKFIGTMELGKVVSGDLARYMESADAQAQIFANTVNKLQTLFGQALSPMIMYATQSLAQLMQVSQDGASPALQGLAKVLVYIIGVARVTARAFWEVGQTIYKSIQNATSVVQKFISGDFEGARMQSMTWFTEPLMDSIGDIKAESEKVMGDLTGIFSNIDTKGLGAYGNVFKEKAQFAKSEVAKAGKEVADKLKKIGEDLASELENYARSTADKVRSFNESMKSLVVQHRNAIKDLRTQIEGLNADFAEASKERAEQHTEKKSEISQRYEDETKTLQENLARRLTDSKGSDAQLIAFYQAQIAEKQRLMEEELRKEEEKFAKEEAKQQAAFNKQLTALQTKLNTELEIERKHRAEFEKFKDAVEEDDITRLKSSFEREMSELKRQHDDRMAELRKQQEEILSVKAATSTAAAKAVQQAAQTRQVTVSTTKTNFTPSVPTAVSKNGGYYSPAVPKFHEGGVVPGAGEVPILAKGGEMVMTQQQTQGLMELLKNLGAGVQGGMGSINMTNHIYDKFDFVGAMREAGWRARVR